MGWQGRPNCDSEDSIASLESRLLMDDYNGLIDRYVNLINSNNWRVIIAMPTHKCEASAKLIIQMSEMVKPSHAWIQHHGCLIDVNRNKIVEEAFERMGDDWTHLWFVDSDVLPPYPYALMRLLQRDKDVISGVYCRKTIPARWLNSESSNGVNSFAEEMSPPEDPLNFYPQYKDKVKPCLNMGAGCLLIKREVFHRVSKPWFYIKYLAGTNEHHGEDITFFESCAKTGIVPHMDTSVICKHCEGHLEYPLPANKNA